MYQSVPIDFWDTNKKCNTGLKYFLGIIGSNMVGIFVIMLKLVGQNGKMVIKPKSLSSLSFLMYPFTVHTLVFSESCVVHEKPSVQHIKKGDV